MLDAEFENSIDSNSESKNSLRLWLHLLKCTKQLEQEMSERFRESHSSTISRFDVMAHLSQAGKTGLTTSVLAASLLASKGNITRLLDRMEQDGLLERKASTDDKRVSRVYLSDKGDSMFGQMAQDHENWALEVFEDISIEERDELLLLIIKIRKRYDRKH